MDEEGLAIQADESECNYVTWVTDQDHGKTVGEILKSRGVNPEGRLSLAGAVLKHDVTVRDIREKGTDRGNSIIIKDTIDDKECCVVLPMKKIDRCLDDFTVEQLTSVIDQMEDVFSMLTKHESILLDQAYAVAKLCIIKREKTLGLRRV